MPLDSTPQCRVCGGSVPAISRGRPRTYCSDACRIEWNRSNSREYQRQLRAKRPPRRTRCIECTCLHCGKLFMAYPSRIAAGGGKYCSRSCSMIVNPANPPKPKVTVTCEQCGKQFKRHPAYAATAKYCSKKCYGMAQQQWISKVTCLHVCQHCGNHFELTRKDCRRIMVGKNRRSGKFCSHTCSNAFQAGAANPKDYHRNSQRYRRWRKTVLARDLYICRACGRSGRGMHTHHIKPWAHYVELRYEVSNGVTLCRKCHYAVHSNVLPIQLMLDVA